MKTVLANKCSQAGFRKGRGKKERKKVKSLSCAQLFVTPWMVACTRLLHPWDFQGKSTGVGCHFLLQVIQSNPGLSHCRHAFLNEPPREVQDVPCHNLHPWTKYIFLYYFSRTSRRCHWNWNVDEARKSFFIALSQGSLSILDIIFL